MSDNENLVLDAIKKDNKISILKLTETTNLSRRTVARIIKTLKDNGNIERVGSDKSGYWKVIEK